MPAPVVTPLEPPYTPDIEAMLKKWMPPGAHMAPLALFRSLAKNEQLMAAMRPLGSYFLGSHSPLSIRLRELLILRSCLLSNCEYEWGVHATAFAAAAQLTSKDVDALSKGSWDDIRWTPAEQMALKACDQLIATANMDADTRLNLRTYYNEAEILAIIALISWYRLISCLANTVCGPLEPWAARFPATT
ncbi:carboxymuconolactone decarboxylase family protein [Kordiimonas sp.]|uniref:carboxymuconolactone decarboxylase family protein n=1 Tax=Kordiimonas sp. TaxID=1970157 RepID=UPI003A909993